MCACVRACVRALCVCVDVVVVDDVIIVVVHVLFVFYKQIKTSHQYHTDIALRPNNKETSPYLVRIEPSTPSTDGKLARSDHTCAS